MKRIATPKRPFGAKSGGMWALYRPLTHDLLHESAETAAAGDDLAPGPFGVGLPAHGAVDRLRAPFVGCQLGVELPQRGQAVLDGELPSEERLRLFVRALDIRMEPLDDAGGIEHYREQARALRAARGLDTPAGPPKAAGQGIRKPLVLPAGGIPGAPVGTLSRAFFDDVAFDKPVGYLGGGHGGARAASVVLIAQLSASSRRRRRFQPRRAFGQASMRPES